LSDALAPGGIDAPDPSSVAAQIAAIQVRYAWIADTARQVVTIDIEMMQRPVSGVHELEETVRRRETALLRAPAESADVGQHGSLLAAVTRRTRRHHVTVPWLPTSTGWRSRIRSEWHGPVRQPPRRLPAVRHRQSVHRVPGAEDIRGTAHAGEPTRLFQFDVWAEGFAFVFWPEERNHLGTVETYCPSICRRGASAAVGFLEMGWHSRLIVRE
jgi:hypothetical protein